MIWDNSQTETCGLKLQMFPNNCVLMSYAFTKGFRPGSGNGKILLKYADACLGCSELEGQRSKKQSLRKTRSKV